MQLKPTAFAWPGRNVIGEPAVQVGARLATTWRCSVVTGEATPRSSRATNVNESVPV